MNWRKVLWKVGAALAGPLLLTACLQTPVETGGVEVGDEDGNSVTAQAVPTNGLKGDYFDNIDFTGTVKTRYDANVNRNWGTAAPITGIQPTTYSVRWMGQVMPAFSQTYTFFVTSSDGARLMVNGQVLVNDWTDGASRVRSGMVALQANVKYDIRLEYYRNTTNPGSVKLEWQSPSRTKQVVPQASLFTTGSNLESIITPVLTNESGFQSLGITLDPLFTFVAVAPSGTAMFGREQGSTNTIRAVLINGKVGVLIRQVNSGGNATVTNLLTGRAADLGVLSTYANPDGTQSQAQRDALVDKFMVVGARDSGVFRTSISIQRLKPQGLLDNTCVPCQTEWEEWKKEERLFWGGFVAGTIITVGTAGNVTWAALAIGAGSYILPDVLKDRDEAGDDYARCRYKNCSPVLIEPTPNVIRLEKQLSETWDTSLTFGNAVNSPSVLLYNISAGFGITQLRSNQQNYYGHLDGTYRNLLLPGVSETFLLSGACPQTESIIRGEIELVYNGSENPLSVTVPVEIQCKVSIISVDAYIGGSVSGSVLPSGFALPITAVVNNDPSNAGVTWSVPSGIGSIVTINGQPHYKAPLINPENRSVPVVATSNADPTKQGNAYANVYAIQIQAYINSSVSDSVMASISTLPLTAAINNDAMHGGAIWSIPGGTGSIVMINGQPHYLSRPDTPADEFVTLKATSVSDPTKWSLATVRVLAIRVNATINGSVNGSVVASGGTVPIQGGVVNDGSHGGVDWRVVSGGGSVSGETFQAPTLACFPSGGTPTSVTSVLRATSNTDGSKYADASVRVFSVQCP